MAEGEISCKNYPGLLIMKRKNRSDVYFHQWHEFARNVIDSLLCPAAVFSGGGDLLSGNNRFEHLVESFPGITDSISLKLTGRDEISSMENSNSRKDCINILSSSGVVKIPFVSVAFEDQPGDIAGWLILVSSVPVPGYETSELSCEERVLAIKDSCKELEHALDDLCRGNRVKIAPLDPDDPLYRLKRRYNEAIDTVGRLLSLKGLFGN